MPPRTRKTAAAAPDPKDKAAGGETQDGESVVIGSGGPELFVPADDATAMLEQEGRQIVAAAAKAGLKVSSNVAETGPSPTYHWRQADGRPGTPCRLCAPAGPPPSAGSFGCGHGQWVFTLDGS